MKLSRIKKVARSSTAICSAALSIIIISQPAFPQPTSAGVRLQAGMTKENVDGDLKSAMDIYQKIADDRSAPRDVRSKALLRLAGCYEKLGGQAQKVYEEVVRNFADQPAAAQARNRLAALRQEEHEPATMTQRKIELPFPSRQTFEVFQTDGKRQLYKDGATGPLMISDLAGNNKRVVFEPKVEPAWPGIFYIPSRDLSMVFVAFHAANAPFVRAVIKTDGTGYREISGISHESGSSTPDWSWDNRYLFSCEKDPDGTPQLVRFSAADGELRRLRAMDCAVSRPSPDGRFVALATGRRQNFGKVLIMPSQGGEPQQVFDHARLLDWTRDGHYLLIDSPHSGAEALYMLPIQDGQVAGDPIFVQNGPFMTGSTNASGALVYRSSVPGGGFAAWLGTRDAFGRVSNWQNLNLAANFGYSFDSRWSPDSSQILYVAPNEATKADRWALRLRNIATGEERVVYRGSGDSRPNCNWAQQTPNLVCVQSRDLVSVSIDTGRVERLGSLAAGGNSFFFDGGDARTFYVWRQPGFEFTRWDANTQQETTLDRLTGFGQISSCILFPDQRWMARRNKGAIEIRPTGGGDWKPLISLAPTEMAFTPDGNWVLYHGVDAAGKPSLFRVSTTGGQPERVGDFPSSTQEGFLSVSPDGQKMIAEIRIAPEEWVLENYEPKH
jgi:Tol biopolymer transport system component